MTSTSRRAGPLTRRAHTAARPGELTAQTAAIAGGPKAKTVPYGAGKRFGPEELQQLKEALDQNTLFYAFGKKTAQFKAAWSAYTGVKHVITTSSGTAALHCAVAAAGVGVGDEVVTAPITDLGSVIGVLYQGAVPVFADLDPHTYMMTAESIAKVLTKNTRAVIVVHLAGNCADMDPIVKLCKKHKLVLIEDCAQSFGARDAKGRLAGTFGAFGCFSTNDFKHISTGDGGMVVTNNDGLALKAQLFSDKAYRRDGSPNNPEFLAPNYRMTELQAAVGIAQIAKLPKIVARRRQIGDRFTERIAGLPGLSAHGVKKGFCCTYWFYMFCIDEKKLGATRKEFVKAVAAEGITLSLGYIDRPVYRYNLFTDRNILRHSEFPLTNKELKRRYEYPEGLCPVAEEIIATACRLPVNEFFTDQDTEEVCEGLEKVVHHFQSKNQ
ncbi:MAG: DegT/DnrJ/EryC1/StrS family aminotransferase [Planctomycetota bacterium]